MRPARPLLTALTLSAAGCGVTPSAGPATDPTPAPAAREPNEPVWADVADKPVRAEGLEFSLMAAERKRHDDVPSLFVILGLVNKTADKRFALKGWGFDKELIETLTKQSAKRDRVSPTTLAGVELRDERGNVCRLLMRNVVTRAGGAGTAAEVSLGPGEAAGLGYDCERPPPGFTELRLTIPGEDVGLKEPVRLSFPASKVVDEKD